MSTLLYQQCIIINNTPATTSTKDGMFILKLTISKDDHEDWSNIPFEFLRKVSGYKGLSYEMKKQANYFRQIHEPPTANESKLSLVLACL